MSIIGLIVLLLVMGVLLWAAQRILAVIPIVEPFRTIVYVLVVLLAVFVLLDAFGLWPAAGGLSLGCIGRRIC